MSVTQMPPSWHTKQEIEEYFAAWRADIEEQEQKLIRQKMDYALCLREYQACRKIVEGVK